MIRKKIKFSLEKAIKTGYLVYVSRPEKLYPTVLDSQSDGKFLNHKEENSINTVIPKMQGKMYS